MTDGTCCVPECDRVPFCRGMCRRHYRAAMGHDAPAPATCAMCGAEYLRQRKARTNYCPPCSDKSPRKVAANRANAEARRKNWPTSRVTFPICPCGRMFTARHASAVYCSDECRPKSVWPTMPCKDCGRPKELLDTYCRDCRRVRLVASRKAARAKRPRGQETHRRRARRFGVEYEPINRRKVYDRDGWRCGICHQRIDKRLSYPHLMSASLDHIVPLSQGGGHVYANVQAAHFLCNSVKGDRSAGDQLLLFGAAG